MNVPKKSGIAFVLVGTVLILSALSLFLYNRYEDAQVGQEAESLLADVQTLIETALSPKKQYRRKRLLRSFLLQRLTATVM